MNRTEQKFEAMGSGCGSVGRAVAYNGTRGLQFESAKFYTELVFNVNCWKDKKWEK